MSLVEFLDRDDHWLWAAFAASLVLHFILFHAGDLAFVLPSKPTVEIDITNMGHMGTPGPRRAAAPAPPPKPVPAPKQWTAPRPDQKVAPAPIPTKAVAPSPEPPAPQPPAQTGTGEIGIGVGDGSEGQLARLPQLLNLNDLDAIQQRFYPEQAREDGKEAVVVMDIHIGTDGRVTNAEVVQSADPQFDDAAVRVARLLRFTPAYLGSAPVAVKMRQAIQFKLRR